MQKYPAMLLETNSNITKHPRAQGFDASTLLMRDSYDNTQHILERLSRTCTTHCADSILSQRTRDGVEARTALTLSLSHARSLSLSLSLPPTLCLCADLTGLCRFTQVLRSEHTAAVTKPKYAAEENQPLHLQHPRAQGIDASTAPSSVTVAS